MDKPKLPGSEVVPHAPADHAVNEELNAITQYVPLGCRQANSGGPLRGWTLAVKDNIDVRGTVRGNGQPLKGRIPAEADAVVVQQLREAVATPIAKTNMEEMALGATTDNPYFGPCRNPWDLARTPGGSSGGSAVVVAAGIVRASLGTDTGGSVRNPASFCGVTGVRPTPGLVSLANVEPLSLCFDTVGVFARTAVDAASVLRVLGDGAPSSAADLDPWSLRIAFASMADLGPMDDQVRDAFRYARQWMADQGLRVHTLRLRGISRSDRAFRTLLLDDILATHIKWQTSLEALHPSTRLRLTGGRPGEAEVAAAQQEAGAWRDRMASLLDEYDVVVLPTTPITAPRFSDIDDRVAVSAEINRFNTPWSLAGIPAVAIPGPKPHHPVGMQLVGQHHSDFVLLRFAAWLQSLIDWKFESPPHSVKS